MSKKADITTLGKEELIDQVTQPQHQVALLQKMVFGPRNERFKLSEETPANQLSLGVSTEPIAEVKVEKTTVKSHDRNKVKLEAKKAAIRSMFQNATLKKFDCCFTIGNNTVMKKLFE